MFLLGSQVQCVNVMFDSLILPELLTSFNRIRYCPVMRYALG